LWLDLKINRENEVIMMSFSRRILRVLPQAPDKTPIRSEQDAAQAQHDAMNGAQDSD
jgi:hypothetical protein